MERQNPPNGVLAADQLADALSRAVSDVASMTPGEQREWAMRGLATLLLAAPQEVRVAAWARIPELSSAEPIPDTYFFAVEEQAAPLLTDIELQQIDQALLAAARSNWRGTSRVIGDAMVTLQRLPCQHPLAAYMQRVVALVQDRKLEAQGNVQFMRLSEVRLSTTDQSAA